MASVELKHRPVKPRHDDADQYEDLGSSISPEMSEEEESRNTSSEEDDIDSDTASMADNTDASSLAGEDPQSEASEEQSEDPAHFLKDVSFGTLAEAAESFQPKSRKRKLPDDFGTQPDRKPNETVKTTSQVAEQTQRPRPPPRQSKHAPTILSSRQQVSRKRAVFEPSSSAKPRDPRFDATIQSSHPNPSAIDKASKNYSFLSSYQATEILDLKSRIKRTKDPDIIADLKQQVMSFENKLRAAEAKQRERDVVKQHTQSEKDAIRTGQKSKPYYLKQSDVKRMADEERKKGMSKKAQDKTERNRVKRQKTKEARNMPLHRRE